MTKILAGVVTLLLLLTLSGSVFGEEPAGKKIFVDQKCNVCHSIQSQNVEKKGPAVKPGAKNAPPDLSTIGDQKSAEWIEKYLTKVESLNNKKHAKGWTGKPEDLKTVSEWLATLKKAQ